MAVIAIFNEQLSGVTFLCSPLRYQVTVVDVRQSRQIRGTVGSPEGHKVTPEIYV